MNIKIRRQQRKSLLMRVVRGGVEVYIPRWLKPDSAEVQIFIQKALVQLESKIPPKREEITSRATLRALTTRWAKKMGLRFKRVSFRDMRRKWGSCSYKGNITLNSELCSVPIELAEYVIVHELAHLKILDHSPAFWQLVEQYLPDYADRKERLEAYS
ncbi:MAG: M48 family metallopeptidase [Anaerolineae bacterium]|nr:M48 family metallopeptidase [Anaerolineae bacterium]